MEKGHYIIEFSVKRPRAVTWVMILTALFIAVLSLLPTLWPRTFRVLHGLEVDTDPENMLPSDEPVRLFHDRMKREMSIHDMVIVGIVNEDHPDGVFNPDSLRKIYELTQFAKGLRWKDPEDPQKTVGVIEADLIAPSTVDNIEQSGPGAVRFDWLMSRVPETREEALAIRRKAERIPFLKGTLLSEDGKALGIYLPLTSKDVSYKVYSALLDKIATFSGQEQFFITGLPVAEDTFGVQMFKEMAISAPIAMAVIFALMLLFFRKLVLILSPMIVAMVSVICTMGLLVAMGNIVHIMSSMIPIFIVPIAVLDAIHILSEFFDRFQESRDRRKTILQVMDTLFTPMLYTSLTTAVGFASLALTPIPPVQVFGLFVALGVMTAWFWTVTFIPAFVMMLPERSLENFGSSRVAERKGSRSPLSAFLAWLGRLTYARAKVILVVTLFLGLVAAYGIIRIRINDNPTKWFTPSHPIRVADRVLNRHFGGTYMAYLSLERGAQEKAGAAWAEALLAELKALGRRLGGSVEGAEGVIDQVSGKIKELTKGPSSPSRVLEGLVSFVNERMESGPPKEFDAWDRVMLFLERKQQEDQVFKDPKTLAYVEALQKHLLATGIVGKSNALPDLVKTVYRELLSGEDKDFRLPASSRAVAQVLITFQNSHRPQDLWHFVTPDYRKRTVIWVQLKSGDNRDMSKVTEAVDLYFQQNPPPFQLRPKWFGMTYINVIWQNKMVRGMLQAFLGSFLGVFLMMTLLYRSAIWGIMCMIPLTVTIGVIYGTIGLVGKDYDMPVAVLSSLSLGLAVDYAIHFLSRSRRLHEQYGSWKDAAGPVFGEPARAIARNAIVVGAGFLPLLAAPLVPYQTVGIFIAAILLMAAVASLMLLPALIRLLERWMFPETEPLRFACKCTTCAISAAAGVALVALTLQRFISIGWTTMTLLSILVILLLAGICTLMSRREACSEAAPSRTGGTE